MLPVTFTLKKDKGITPPLKWPPSFVLQQKGCWKRYRNKDDVVVFLLWLTASTHALLEKRKGLKKNVGLDFSISFENWLNLWKYKHWKLVEAKLHTWYALYSALCVRVFVFFVVVVVRLFFIFQCSWFSVSSSIFFRCSFFFFFAL